MMDIKLIFFILLSVEGSYGLTASEIAAFNNGVVVNSSLNSTYYKITASGLPNHGTQKVNPNDASQQNHDVWISQSPKFTNDTCLPLGQIAIAKNGVSLFNPLTGGGDDVVTGPNKEIFDR